MLDFQRRRGFVEEFFASLGRCPLFAGLSPQRLEELLPQLRPIRMERGRGEALLHPGQAAPGVGVVLSGSLRIVREDFWGNRALLAPIAPGDVFAETFACAGLPLNVRVEAAGEAEVVFFPVETLLDPPAGGEELPGRLLTLLARKNLMLNRKIGHLSQRSIRAKVLSYLSDQAQAAGKRTFTIPLDRQELADYLSVDRSALSAQLGKLRREGILDFHRSRFTLCRGPEE